MDISNSSNSPQHDYGHRSNPATAGQRVHLRSNRRSDSESAKATTAHIIECTTEADPPRGYASPHPHNDLRPGFQASAPFEGVPIGGKSGETTEAEVPRELDRLATDAIWNRKPGDPGIGSARDIRINPTPPVIAAHSQVRRRHAACRRAVSSRHPGSGLPAENARQAAAPLNDLSVI